jgi:hypothetical protein
MGISFCVIECLPLHNTPPGALLHRKKFVAVNLENYAVNKKKLGSFNQPLASKS